MGGEGGQFLDQISHDRRAWPWFLVNGVETSEKADV